MPQRITALNEWLNTLANQSVHLAPLAGDASFRRYFRVHYEGQSYIAMDAPPQQENLTPFLQVAQILAQAQVNTPKILATNQEQGFLLLSDLGDQLLLHQLKEQTADQYYREAIKTLIQMQHCSTTEPILPTFDQAFMLQEMSYCVEWFFKGYLSLKLASDELQLIQHTLEIIAQEVALQPQVFIHRDYHSRNLMVVENETQATLGVIDFQDAMSGPLTYDLVSLLKDCYISWPRDKVLDWLTWFHTLCPFASSYSLEELISAFDWCGLQRHLKILGIFCRLHLRDQKPGYLQHLPLTLNYVLECTKTYKALYPFYEFLTHRVSLP